MIKKFRPYAILTTGDMRIEVKARNVTEAYRKAYKEVERLNKSRKIKKLGVEKQDLTQAYETFGREGISLRGFESSPASISAVKAYERRGEPVRAHIRRR